MKMRDRTTFVVALVLTALPIPTVAAQAPGGTALRPIVASDLLRIRAVTDIDVARDGSRAVYAVRSIAESDDANAPDEQAAGDTVSHDTVSHDTASDDHMVPSYAYRSHLFLVDLDRAGAKPRQLTWGDRRDGSPTLSPDGRTLAFVRADGDLPQIWVMPIDGGEARVLTGLEHGAWGPRWSPDGRRLLGMTSAPLDEIEGTPPWPWEYWGRTWRDDPDAAPDVDGDLDALRAWLHDSAERGQAHVIGRLHFQGEHDLAGPLEVGQIMTIDAETGTATPLTHGFVSNRSARWMPDGEQIVAVRTRDETIHPDTARESKIVLLDAATGAARDIMNEPGWSIFAVEPAADGSAIACMGEAVAGTSFAAVRLGLVTVPAGGSTSTPVWLTSDSAADGFDVTVDSFAWNAERSALLFTAPIRGGFPLLTMGLGLIEPTTVLDRAEGLPLGVTSFEAGGGAIVYAVTHPRNPSVLRVRDARGDRVLDNLNPWLRDCAIALPVEGSVERADGTVVQYWTMQPPDRAAGERVPLVVEVHGGPHVMWGPGEFTMWHEFQWLCAQGFGVAYGNPRGSAGYGTPYREGNRQNWGDGPGGDVLAMADEVALVDWVDRDRLFLTGGSYGGYLTAWIVAHDHRFKAAVAQRGVYDLATFFGEGNAWQLVPWEMDGYPWDARVRPILQRESPFAEVHRIRTPLMIMHASEDLRTGVSQSEMLYRALKVLGRPVEYVRYPDAGHDLSRTGDPGQRLDRLGRIVEFFRRAEKPAGG